MVYHYEKTTDSIKDWLGFKEEQHIFSRKKFNPEISIKNTKLWEKISGVEKDIRYIEETLTEYLYPYSGGNMR